ncbi:MAG TPA: T9SS type A sorting domain-containing protein, partial [Chitinophagaceae bacterium]
SDGRARMELISQQGIIARQQDILLSTGVNPVDIANTSGFPAGMYILRVTYGENIVQRRLVKFGGH